MDFIKITSTGYIKFYNPILKKTITIGKSTTPENDYKIYCDYEKQFYRENYSLVPKYITLCKTANKFVVGFQFKKYHYHLGKFNSLVEAEKQLLDFKIFLLT
jgi:hypothetical protein